MIDNNQLSDAMGAVIRTSPPVAVSAGMISGMSIGDVTAIISCGATVLFIAYQVYDLRKRSKMLEEKSRIELEILMGGKDDTQ